MSKRYMPLSHHPDRLFLSLPRYRIGFESGVRNSKVGRQSEHSLFRNFESVFEPVPCQLPHFDPAPTCCASGIGTQGPGREPLHANGERSSHSSS